MKRLVLLGLTMAVVLAGGLSLYASSAPDGLERVAQDHGFAAAGTESAAAGAVLADYTVAGSDAPLSGAMAGLIGVVVTAAVGFGLFRLIRGRQN